MISRGPGIDVFSAGMMERYFGAYRAECGLTSAGLLDLGRIHPGRHEEPFNLATLAIRTAGFTNGVSRLHAKVSREMWQELWPKVPVGELPITHVTNGVHPGSWLSDDMKSLYDRYLGPNWSEEPGDTRVWLRAEPIPAEELWRTHERRRERLVAFVRRYLAARLGQRAPARPSWLRSQRSSTPRPSRSASPAGSRPTSAARCCCAIPKGSNGS